MDREIENTDLKRKNNNKADLTEFRILLDSTSNNTKKTETAKPQTPTPADIEQENLKRKIEELRQKREKDIEMNPSDYPRDYFFSAVAELVLE